MSEKTEHPRKNWYFSQSLRAILEKHTLELSDEELEEVSLSIRDNIPENTIKEWLQLPLSCMHQKRLAYSHKHYNSDISSNEFGYSGNIHVPMVLLLDAIPHKIPEYTELSLLDSEELLCSIGKCTQGHVHFQLNYIHLLTNMEKLQDQMLQTERVLDRVFLQLNFSRQMVEKSAQWNTNHNLTPQELLKYIPWNLEEGIIGSLQQRLYAMERTIRRLQKTAKQLHLQLSETNPKMKPNYLYL